MGCTERKVDCHVKCEKYKGWKRSGIEIKSDFIEISKKRRRRK
jgi:hypothetical protein